MDPGPQSGSTSNTRIRPVDSLYSFSNDVPGPPTKKRKTNAAARQTEIKSGENAPKQSNVADLRMVLEQATIRNIIAVADDPDFHDKILKSLLNQNIEGKRRLMLQSSAHRRLCLLVLLDDEIVGRTVADYVRSGDFASVGTYTASMAQGISPPQFEWTRLAESDLAVVSVECLLDSLRCRTLVMSEIQSIVVGDPLSFSDAIAELGRFCRAADTHSRPRISAVVMAPKGGEKLPKTYSRVELYLGAKLLTVTEVDIPRPPPPPPETEPEKKAAVAAAGVFRYQKKRPRFWNNISPLPSRAGRLYTLVVSVGDLHGVFHSPVVILTRDPFPELSNFAVFSSGTSAPVRFQRTACLDYNEEQLTALHGYTVRICRIITNRPFSCTGDSLPYLVAPLGDGFSMAQQASPAEVQVDGHIPWDEVQLAADNFIAPMVPEGSTFKDKFAKDAVVQDRKVEFTNRYFVTKVRRDMTPLSKAEDSPREADFENFVEYCRARIKDFQGLKDNTQPMVEVEVVPNMTNHLNPTSKSGTMTSKSPAKYLIPELCQKLTIPASVLRTMLILPSVLRRIDDLLTTKELNSRFFQDAILENHLLSAVTAPAALMECDYERLEFLGDAFLKYVASIYVFVTMPAVGEGELHTARQEIITNRTLLAGATELGLPPYIQSKPFIAKVWEPLLSQTAANEPPIPATSPAMTSAVGDEDSQPAKRSKKQKQKDEQDFQWVGDKTVADVVEAIIGAAYLSGGSHVALNVMKTLNIDMPLVNQWSDFVRVFDRTPLAPRNFVPLVDVKALESIVGCDIKNRDVLAQALTHSSVHGPGYTGYERLEFVGDAILDFFVARYVFESHPALAPGGLTLIKIAMISNSTLGAFCVDAGLYQYFRHASPEVGAAISAYADKIEKAKEGEDDAAELGERLPGQYWLEINPPKVLSDIVESTIGGLYISEEFSDTAVLKFFDSVLRPFYDRHIRMQTLSLHPTTTLFDLLHSYGCQQHRMLKEEDMRPRRCEVIVHDVILASAEDSNIASTSRMAAMCALDALDGDPDFLSRTCDCRANQQSKKVKKTQKADLGYE